MYRTTTSGTKQPTLGAATSDTGPLRTKGKGEPVLMLLHQKSSCAGAVAQWLREYGFELDIRRPALGEELPQHLEHHSGVIVFGGPMSANDETPEIQRELDWLAVPLRHRLPYLGICLGAQLMVRQLGGLVQPRDDELVEIGYHPVEATSAGFELTGKWPQKFFQWHREGFTIPHDAVRLATGTRFENQAFVYGDRVFGVQYHPEITLPIIERWSTNAAHMLERKGAHNADRLKRDHQHHGPGQVSWLDSFMKRWVDLIDKPTALED